MTFMSKSGASSSIGVFGNQSKTYTNYLCVPLWLLLMLLIIQMPAISQSADHLPSPQLLILTLTHFKGVKEISSLGKNTAGMKIS